MAQADYKELPKVEIGHDREERQKYEAYADFYAVIISMEHLEKAFVRDVLSDKKYTEACKKLITQYRTMVEQNRVPSLEAFSRQFNIECKAAANRFKIGVPATIFHGQSAPEKKGAQLQVFHAVQAFITTMDVIKLGMKAVDELHPSLVELMDGINSVSTLPPDHVSREKVKHWLVNLNGMRATDELTEEQVRQMSFDLETGYNAFHRFVQGD